MTLPSSVWWTWIVRAGTVAAVAVLWIVTAADDSEWMLWRHYSAPTAAMNVAGSAAILAIGYVLSAGGSLAQRLARVVAASAAALATLALLEVPAVVFGHDYGMTFGTHDNDTWLQLARGINRRDDELIHVHWPHSRFRGTVAGNLAWLGLPLRLRYDVDVQHDRNGFRNDVDFTEAQVVAIGDSFVEGAETDKSKTVVAELGRRLRTPAVNLGQSGYGPQQELVVLKRYGLPLSPRVVVWFLFGGNDLSDVDTYEWRQKHLDEFLAPQPVSSRLFSRNALAAIARLTTPARRTASRVAKNHEVVFTRADGTPELIYLDAAEGPWTAHQWEVTSTTLVDARNLSTRAGADLLVVFIPRKQRVYQGYIQAPTKSFANTWRPNNLPEVLGAFCAANGIAFLDSTVPLRRAVAAGESVYLPDDVHWNPAGHRVVAEAVGDRILQMGRVIADNGASR